MGPGGDTRRAGLRGSSERRDGAPGRCARLPHAPAHPPHARCSCPGRAPFLSRAVCACPWPGQRAARLWAAEACAPRCLTGVLLIPGAPWQRGRQSRVTLAEPAGSGLRPPPVPHVTAHGELGRAVPPPQPAAVGSAGPPPWGAEGDHSPGRSVPEARVSRLPFPGSRSAPRGGAGGGGRAAATPSSRHHPTSGQR